MQARTLEIYAHLGIADEAVALGQQATGANLWARGCHAARVPLGDLGRDLSPFPCLLILGQDDNERLLGDHLKSLGTQVDWSTRLAGLSPADDHVLASLEREDGSTVEVKAEWLAGCDGAHSAVRDLNQTGFPGAPYEHVFFVADTRATGPMVPDELNIYLWRRGFYLFFPMRGSDHWRVVGILSSELRNRDDLKFEDVAPSIGARAGRKISFRDCSWFSTYRIHHRRAERFRTGRCFLLGDAAHIHSPAGAQGMNTGLQDAYNLGWKLAWVARGLAGEPLLDTYAKERIPVAERLLKTTDQAFSVAVSGGRLAELLRLRVAPTLLAFALRFGIFRRLAFRTVSQIGIRYPHSPLSSVHERLPSGAPEPGDRFPWITVELAPGGACDLFGELDDTRFNLLLFGEQPLLPDGWDEHDLVRAVRIPGSPANRDAMTRAGIPSFAFFLLRPDGHIGVAGREANIDVLQQYLNDSLCRASAYGPRD